MTDLTQLSLASIVALFVGVIAWRTGFAHYLFTERPITGWIIRTLGNLQVLFWPQIKFVKSWVAFVVPWLTDRKNTAIITNNAAMILASFGGLVGHQLNWTPEQIGAASTVLWVIANMIHPYSVPTAPKTMPEVEPGGMMGPGAQSGVPA